MTSRPALSTTESPAPTDDDSDDRGLVDRCRSGDAAAFRRLVDRHKGRWFKLAYGLLRDREEAADVVQEACIRVHRNLAGFQGESSFATWSWRIVRNLSLDGLRRRKPSSDELEERTHATPDFADDLGTASSPNPQKAALRVELSVRLQQALQTLSTEHRTILVMREVEGLSYEELAEALSIPVGTVMSRLFHARRRMQVALRPYLDDENAP